jgi:hypothetical protein
LKRFKLVLISLGGILVLLIVSVGLYVATLDDDDYRRLVAAAVERFTGYQVVFKGAFSVDLSTEPSLSASEIHFEAKVNGSDPPIDYIGQFKIRLALAPLISGVINIKELFADEVKISVLFGEALEPQHRQRPSAEAPSKVVIPIIESLTLRNVTADFKDRRTGNTTKLRLPLLTVDDTRDTGPMYVKAAGALGTYDFQLNGQLGPVADLFDTVNPYPIELELTLADVVLAVSGTVDDPAHGKGLKVRVVAEVSDMGTLLRTFKADYPNLGQLSLDAKIVGDACSPGLADMQLVLSRASDFNMVAKGSMGDMLTGNNTSIQVSGSCADKDILQMLLPEGLPEIDRLEGDLLIRDGDGVYVLEALKLTGSNKQGATMKAKGTMGFSRAIGQVPAFRELDLNCQLSSPTTESAKFPAIDFLPELGAMSATGRVRLSGDLLRFEDLAVHSSHAQGLQVDTAGTLRISLDEAKDTPVQIDFKARVAAPNMGAAKPLLGKVYLSRAGPVLGEGRITGTSEALSVEDLSITVGKSGPVRARWQGRIGRVPLSSGELPSDVDIVGAIDADEASVVASLAAISLPNLGPLKTTLRIVEQGGIYRFKEIQLAVGSQERLWLKGAGSFGLVMKDGSVSLGELDVEVEASAPNLAAVPKTADLDLPDLQPLKLKARVIDRDGHLNILDIEEFKFDAGTGEDAFLRIQAQASGLRSSDQRVLEASFKTTSRPWVMKILEGSTPENHVVEGKLKIAGTPKHMRIEELEVGTTGPKRLYLEADGTVKEIEGTHEFEGHIASGASHISVLGSFLGIELPPFGAPLLEGQITGNTKKASFKGTVRLGNSRLGTTLSHSLTKKRPRVTAKIVAPTVYLADVGVYPKQPKDLPPEIESEPQPDKRLFGEEPLPFHALKAIDLAVSVDVKRMMGEDFVLRDLDFDMSLENGKLRIAPATVTYANGSASIDCTVDAVNSRPEMALKVTAEDVEIGSLLAHLHAQPFVKGQLNLVVDLQSSGKSPREMATALEGEFGVAVEKGKIKRVVEFMGADAVDFLTAVRSKAEYKDLHCMALRFVFEGGMGKSEMIYLETPNMYAGGVGSIDLHTETMEIALQPKPKKGFRGTTSPVHIKGPIGDPKVRKLPFREAARLFGEIAMPVVFLPARGLGYLWYLIRKDEAEQSPCFSIRPPDGNLGETH